MSDPVYLATLPREKCTRMARGLVQEIVLSCGHMVPMELVQETAEVCAGFIDVRIASWQSRTAHFQQAWERVPHHERVSVGKQWEEKIGTSPKNPKNPKP